MDIALTATAPVKQACAAAALHACESARACHLPCLTFTMSSLTCFTSASVTSVEKLKSGDELISMSQGLQAANYSVYTHSA